DDLVDLLLVQLRAAHEGLAEVPRVRVDGMARPEFVEMRLGVALALDVQLIEELERDLPRLSPSAHLVTRRGSPRLGRDGARAGSARHRARGKIRPSRSPPARPPRRDWRCRHPPGPTPAVRSAR